jgi:hypothetical protein
VAAAYGPTSMTGISVALVALVLCTGSDSNVQLKNQAWLRCRLFLELS